MRFRERVLMVLLLTGMLVLTFLGGMSLNREPEPEPVDNVDPAPVIFKGSINDGYGVPSELMDVIVAYMDAYYRSIYDLQVQDVSGLFCDQRMAAVTEKANGLLIETRKLYDFDFRMSEGHYDLTVTDYYQQDGKYYVDILEDDHMSFMFLEGIESRTYDVENYFVFRLVDGEYRICDLEKIQGYYMAFYNESDVKGAYEYYCSRLKDRIAYDREVLKPEAQSVPFTAEKTYRKAYDRQSAVAYADRYYHERNGEWYNFSDEGGNCQNYASQCLLAGGIPMDYTGEWQWKCYIEDPDYDPWINEEDMEEGRSRSWVHVPSFYEYADGNSAEGLVAQCGVNLNYAEPGDLIIVGNGELSHTVIVSKVIDGHILVDSNSIDMKDYPIEAYTYLDIVLVKIIGSN